MIILLYLSVAVGLCKWFRPPRVANHDRTKAFSTNFLDIAVSADFVEGKVTVLVKKDRLQPTCEMYGDSCSQEWIAGIESVVAPSAPASTTSSIAFFVST